MVSSPLATTIVFYKCHYLLIWPTRQAYQPIVSADRSLLLIALMPRLCCPGSMLYRQEVSHLKYPFLIHFRSLEINSPLSSQICSLTLLVPGQVILPPVRSWPRSITGRLVPGIRLPFRKIVSLPLKQIPISGRVGASSCRSPA